MDLWIRTQNKEMLILIKGKIEIDFIPSFDAFGYYFGLKYNNDILGTYEGKERALEVLNEIQNRLITLCDSMNRYLYVYEMPKE